MTPYELAYDYVMHTSRCIFLTGKAGTGKTTLLRRLRVECPKQMMVVAPTGVAAINAEGVTIHSLFQLPPQLFLPTTDARNALFREMQMRTAKQRLLRSLELLVIDEVSMVRSDLLDAIDAVLRHFRHRPNQPFGGVQMLFIGDLYQLSPVAREDEWHIMQQYYSGPYFFQARVFSELQPVYIELDHVFRQSDSSFVHILNEVRNNCLSTSSIQLLNSRFLPNWQPQKGEPYHIILSTHNHKVDSINTRELEQLKGNTFTFHAKIDTAFPESMYPMDPVLTLKKGARVMFIKNDSSPEKAYYNGRLGLVSDIDDEQIIVTCDSPDGTTEEVPVHLETWEYIRYTTPKNGQEVIQPEVAGRFTHYPLRLAWAVTIHKAQGLTFDHVVIDAADAFASGQVYVALSRCRSLNGIVLLSHIPEHALTNAPDVLSFSANQPSMQTTASSFHASSQSYLLQLLIDLYDFRDALFLCEQLLRLIHGTTSFNTGIAQSYLDKLQQSLTPLQPVAEKFQLQLQHILSSPQDNTPLLTQRLQAAAGYFTSTLKEVLTAMQSSPVYTDNRADAKDFSELMENLYQHLHLKSHLMNAIAAQPAISRWFQARQSYHSPSYHISAQGSDIQVSTTESEHPLLLDKLKKLRTRIAKEKGWEKAVFRVCGTKTLVAISNALPTNKQQLLQVYGFGPKSYEEYGERILHVVNNYLK